MNIFYLSKSSINKYIQVLQEKKTKEEYSRDSFKKKYNYKPNNKDKNIGTISTKDGQIHKVNISKNNKEIYSLGDNIYLGRKFFKLKGSNNNERRDAILHHEIGHTKFHNINSKNNSTEKKNKTPEVFKNNITNSIKDQYKINLNNNTEKRLEINKDPDMLLLGKKLKYKGNAHQQRKQLYDDSKIKEYIKNSAEKDDKKKRNNDLNIAKKYEKPEKHNNAAEYEADRYSANHTSERAVKKANKNMSSLSKKDSNITKKELNNDMVQRSKALKDKDLKKSNRYK